MIIALIILFFVTILDFFIILLFFSNIVLEFKDVECYSTNIKNIVLERAKINLQIYLFRKIRILNVKVFKTHVEVFGLKISLKNLYKFADREHIYINFYNFLKFIKSNHKEISFKYLKPVIDNFDMNLSFSTDNAISTSFLTFSISTFISMILKKFIKKYKKEKFYYRITPKYINTYSFNFNFTSSLSFSTINLFIFVYKLRRLIKENTLFEKEKLTILSSINRVLEVLRILNKVRKLNEKERVNNFE